MGEVFRPVDPWRVKLGPSLFQKRFELNRRETGGLSQPIDLLWKRTHALVPTGCNIRRHDGASAGSSRDL